MKTDPYGEFTAEESEDPFVVEGLGAVGVYLARVAAFTAWVAEHGEPRVERDVDE
jgi:dethiobiotin synthetase